MLNPVYNLPEIHFVGGESQHFLFNLLTASGYEYDATNCEVGFAIINYTNKNGSPIITKNATIIDGANGVKNVAEVKLAPTDTLYLYGRYIYQITVNGKDSSGGKISEIPGQGIIDITRNIHTEYVK